VKDSQKAQSRTGKPSSTRFESFNLASCLASAAIIQLVHGKLSLVSRSAAAFVLLTRDALQFPGLPRAAVKETESGYQGVRRGRLEVFEVGGVKRGQLRRDHLMFV
jgi:hypothetical protein